MRAGRHSRPILLPSLELDPMREAAEKVIEKPLAGLYAGIMEDALAVSYHRLLEYHEACAKSVCIELQDSKGTVAAHAYVSAGF